MTIQEEINWRKIGELVHFTTNRGIVGVLATKSLLSRFRLKREDYLQHVLHVNSSVRPEEAALFDKSQNWLDFVNLSISHINRRFFDVSLKWHRDADVWWGILAFDPVLMTHNNVMFATTNNAYDLCERKAGLEGLSALFAANVRRKIGWNVDRLQRASNQPTCEQAEVLYPESVSTSFLSTIYVQEEDHHDQVQGWLNEFNLSNVSVVVDQAKFNGCKN